MIPIPNMFSQEKVSTSALGELMVRVAFITSDPSSVTYMYTDDNILVLRASSGDFPGIGFVEYLELSYGELQSTPSEGPKSYDMMQTQYYHPREMDWAIRAFVNRMRSVDPSKAKGYSDNIQTIAIKESQVLFFKNTDVYLNLMLEPFWQQLFGQTTIETRSEGIETWCGGRYQGHLGYWARNGINSNRGRLLYLLTYTKVFGDTPSYHRDKWVVDNYAKYLSMIVEVEEQILAENYKIKGVVEFAKADYHDLVSDTKVRVTNDSVSTLLAAARTRSNEIFNEPEPGQDPNWDSMSESMKNSYRNGGDKPQPGLRTLSDIVKDQQAIDVNSIEKKLILSEKDLEVGKRYWARPKITKDKPVPGTVFDLYCMPFVARGVEGKELWTGVEYTRASTFSIKEALGRFDIIGPNLDPDFDQFLNNKEE